MKKKGEQKIEREKEVTLKDHILSCNLSGVAR